MANPQIIDTDFEVVSGPVRAGDEHPTRKGWYATDRYNRRGVRLWYRPPGLISRWIRRIGIIVFLSLMAFGIGVTILVEGFS